MAQASSSQTPKPPIVLVVGSVNADVVVDIARLPQRGETLSASRPDTGRVVPGGKGANQAAAAARLLPDGGGSARFVGQFGDDAHGATLENSLKAAGVDTSLSGHPKGVPSGQAFVFVYPDGDNSIVIVGGANVAWSEENKLPDEFERAISSASIVLLQCEVPDHVNALVTKTAAQAGVPVMWDTGGDDRALPDDLLPLIEFLCPNETELARIAGVSSVESVEQAVEVAHAMQQRGARNLLVTLGADGSVFVPEGSSSTAVHHQPCFSVKRVVDTTGAGDCYRAAFAVGVAQGRSIPDSMEFAAAASALCVQVAGAQPSMPTAEKVAALLASASSQ